MRFPSFYMFQIEDSIKKLSLNLTIIFSLTAGWLKLDFYCFTTLLFSSRYYYTWICMCGKSMLVCYSHINSIFKYTINPHNNYTFQIRLKCKAESKRFWEILTDESDSQQSQLDITGAFSFFPPAMKYLLKHCSLGFSVFFFGSGGWGWGWGGAASAT